MTLFGSQLWTKHPPRTKLELTVDGCPRKAVVHSRGMLFTDQHGNMVTVSFYELVKFQIPAAQNCFYFKEMD